MPTYRITDNQSGKTYRVTGDSPPTEQEMTQIFSSGGQTQGQTPSPPGPKTPQGPDDPMKTMSSLGVFGPLGQLISAGAGSQQPGAQGAQAASKFISSLSPTYNRISEEAGGALNRLSSGDMSTPSQEASFMPSQAMSAFGPLGNIISGITGISPEERKNLPAYGELGTQFFLSTILPKLLEYPMRAVKAKSLVKPAWEDMVKAAKSAGPMTEDETSALARKIRTQAPQAVQATKRPEAYKIANKWSRIITDPEIGVMPPTYEELAKEAAKIKYDPGSTQTERMVDQAVKRILSQAVKAQPGAAGAYKTYATMATIQENLPKLLKLLGIGTGGAIGLDVLSRFIPRGGQ